MTPSRKSTVAPLALALVLAAGATILAGPRAAADDPEPVPIDCPMCGGNAELHNKRTMWMIGFQGAAVMRALGSSSFWS